MQRHLAVTTYSSVIAIAVTFAWPRHAAAQAEDAAPFALSYRTPASFDLIECNELDVLGGTHSYGSDTLREVTEENWYCAGGECNESGGFATSEYMLGWIRDSSTTGRGGRCESNALTDFTAQGLFSARFWIDSSVRNSTGVFTIGLFPSYYEDLVPLVDLTAFPDFYGAVEQAVRDESGELFPASVWTKGALRGFSLDFEIDLVVANLLDNGVRVAKFGQPHNYLSIPLVDLEQRWVEVYYWSFPGEHHDWSDGLPALGYGYDGKCFIEVYADGTLVDSKKLTSCDYAPIDEWWKREVRKGTARVKGGPGGSKLIVNSRGRDYDSTIGVANDESFMTIDWVRWAGSSGNDELWFGGSQSTGFTDVRNIDLNGNYVPVVGDFDGDGNDDIYLYGLGTSNDYNRWGRQDRGFDSGNTLVINGTYIPVSGDFDGDGRDDIYFYGPGSAADYMRWGRADRGFDDGNALVINGTYEPVVGDFDCDGRDDIYFYGSGSAADYMRWGRADRGFDSGNSLEINGVYEPFAGDFDGDGCDDIFFYGPGSAADRIRFGSASRTFVICSSPTVNGVYEVAVGDFDNNGADDIFWSGSNDYVWFYNNQTCGAEEYVSVDKEQASAATPFAGDFDNDGADDIFWYQPQ